MSNTYLDLPSILSLQSNYLSNLKNQTADPTVKSQVTNLSNSLDGLNTAYTNANVNSDAVLSKQSDVNSMVVAEQNRLQQKKFLIDQALDGRKRLVTLNDSYRLKYTQYIKIILVLIVTLIVWIVLNKLAEMGFLPDPFYTVLVVITIAVGGFVCYFIYLDILSRDNMNFNAINVPAPVKLTPDQIKKSQEAAANSGNLLGTINFGGCIGAECCSDGSKWDAGNSVCIGNSLSYGASTTYTRSPFTTLSISYNVGEIKKPISANSPNEYGDYSKI
jgi:hypothetical protein